VSVAVLIIDEQNDEYHICICETRTEADQLERSLDEALDEVLDVEVKTVPVGIAPDLWDRVHELREDAGLLDEDNEEDEPD
jgi:hypothetical protein